jgi:cardiolipin synthase C
MGARLLMPWKSAQRALAALWLVAICGCAALPPREPVPASSAYTDTAATTLGRIAAQSLPSGAESGFRLLPVGEHAFATRTTLAAKAERSLDAQYYHVHADPAGATFLRELRDAAQRGVRVRLLVDDYHANPVYPLLTGLAAHANVEVRLFNPLPARYGSPLWRLLKSLPEFERANRRMHNKLFVADNAIAVYGGRNVADEYFMRHGVANFIDLDVLSVGAVVPSLSESFDRYWNSEHAYPLQQVLGPIGNAAQARQRFDEQARTLHLNERDVQQPSNDPLGNRSVPLQLAEGKLLTFGGSAQVFADPPEKITAPVLLNKPTAAMLGNLEVIAGARSEVVIVTPYFVPGVIGMSMMEDAAQRGGRTVIITNSLGSTDEPLVHHYYAKYRQAMLRMGVELHELSPTGPQRSTAFGNFGRSTGRLHAKAAVVDQRWLLVGSVNLDGRSALYNTELAVVIDCPPVAKATSQLGAGEGLTSMYRVQLAADRENLEWHILGDDKRPRVHTDEPDSGVFGRFWLWLQSLIIAEDQL